MAQKHVLFTFNHAPYGTIWYNEGLRAVVGVTSGIDEHTVDIVYLGDGVYFTLKGVDRADSAKYLNTLVKLDYPLRVERESLAERGIGEAEVAEDIQIIPRSKVLELVQQADLTIDF